MNTIYTLLFIFGLGTLIVFLIALATQSATQKRSSDKDRSERSPINKD